MWIYQLNKLTVPERQWSAAEAYSHKDLNTSLLIYTVHLSVLWSFKLPNRRDKDTNSVSSVMAQGPLVPLRECRKSLPICRPKLLCVCSHNVKPVTDCSLNPITHSCIQGGTFNADEKLKFLPIVRTCSISWFPFCKRHQFICGST